MSHRSRTRAALAALLLLAPAALSAQRPQGERDVLVRVNGPAHVAEGDTVSTVVSVGDGVRIEGTVLDQLVVVRGTAVVTGTVAGDVVAVNSRLDVQPGATISGDVRLVRSQLAASPDATITGSVRQETGFGIPDAVLWMLYFGVSIIVLFLGLLLAVLAGRQVSEAADVALHQPGGTAIAAIIAAVGLPVVAVAAMLTLVGIPVGIAIFAIAIPVLWFVGYVVAAVAIGRPIARRARAAEREDRPYLAVIVGLVILQLVWLVPFLGGLVVSLAGLWGAGALLYRAWRSRHGEPPERAEALRRAA